MAKTMHVTIATANAGFGYKDEAGRRCVYHRGRVYEVSAEFGEHLLGLRAAGGVAKMFKSVEPTAKVDAGKRERAKDLVDRMAGWDSDKLARFESLAGIVEAGGGLAAAPPSAPPPDPEPEGDDEGGADDEGADDEGADAGEGEVPDPATATTAPVAAPPRTLADRKKRRK